MWFVAGTSPILLTSTITSTIIIIIIIMVHNNHRLLSSSWRATFVLSALPFVEIKSQSFLAVYIYLFFFSYSPLHSPEWKPQHFPSGSGLLPPRVEPCVEPCVERQRVSASLLPPREAASSSSSSASRTGHPPSVRTFRSPGFKITTIITFQKPRRKEEI